MYKQAIGIGFVVSVIGGTFGGTALAGIIAAPGWSVRPVLVAGAPPDSPTNRVDPNIAGSRFAGVGSLSIGGTTLCSGFLISPGHVLSAAHCFTYNAGDFVPAGKALGDFKVTPAQVTFNLNLAVNGPPDTVDTAIMGAALAKHPDWDGFGVPSAGVVNDDLVIVTLASAAPVGVSTYKIWGAEIDLGAEITMAGYGQSGTGLASGYTVPPTFTVKRSGKNVIDSFDLDDEGSGQREVYEFDFDGPTGNGPLGGGTLGNDIETTLGPGDSGSPAFVEIGGVLYAVGVGGFTTHQGLGPLEPAFGSGGGGSLLFPYLDWIRASAPESDVQITTLVELPEPVGLAVFGLGLTGLIGVARRRR